MRKFIIISTFIYLISSVTPHCTDKPAVIHLTPPIINENTILNELKCTRPMREGKFNISTETFNGKKGIKQIVHCYGHGGSGWTTLFGSVSKSIQLFSLNFPESRSKPIRIIGSGCVGLTTAIELKRLGYNVSGISTKELYDLCSWKAAGYFALVSVKTSPEEQESLNAIGIETFRVYQQISRKEHPYLSPDTLRYLPVYCSKDTQSGLEQLESFGLIPPREEVILDFGNGVRYKDFVNFKTYFMDTTKLMKELIKEAQRLDIHIDMRNVTTFDELEEEVIFNCSGIGALELNQDKNMISVRGHLILMNDNAGREHMDYMIYTKVYQNGREEYIYMFPKTLSVTSSTPDGVACYGALGGTFIPDTDKLSSDELADLDKKEFKKLLDRTSLFFHGKESVSSYPNID